MEPRKKNSPECRRRSNIGRQNVLGAILRVPSRLGVVADPGMCVHFLCGNREISRLANSNVERAALARVGKVRNHSR